MEGGTTVPLGLIPWLDVESLSALFWYGCTDEGTTVDPPGLVVDLCVLDSIDGSDEVAAIILCLAPTIGL